jgi:hypothetical protein
MVDDKQKIGGNDHMYRVNFVLIYFLLFLTVFNSPELLGQKYENFLEKALKDSTFTWRNITKNKVRIYYQKDSFAERHRMMILRSVAAAVNEVLTTLDESNWKSVLNVFYLESREEMKRIVGRPYSGFSDWSANAIFIVLNPKWRSFEKHEFAHVVTMGLWGSPDADSKWMIEGIAVYCDGWCRQYTVDEIAFHFLSNNQLPTLQQLFNDFSGLGEIRACISAASFICFIGKKYGVQKVRSLWSNGPGNLEELLGEDLKQVENAWKLYLKESIPEDVNVDLDAINKLGCG